MHTTATHTYTKTRKLTTLAGFAAIACVLMMVVRIPVVSFLSYEPKDVAIVIAGFIFGPLAVFTLSLVVSLVEMVTVSDTGPIGLIMNIISTCAFACTAAAIYKRRKTLSGAVFGLVCGALLSTSVMMLWNYIIVPIYLGIPREAVVEMLLPVFLPFNLVKGGLNAALTLLLYKPLMKALRAARVVPEGENQLVATKSGILGVFLVAGLLLISCVLVVLVFQGII